MRTHAPAMRIIGWCAGIGALLLAGCGDDPAADAGTLSAGRFQGTVDGIEYAVDVHCMAIDAQRFRFRSDRSDVADTDGDGLVITGTQTGDRFALTVMVGDVTHESTRLERFSRDTGSASGSGTMTREGAIGRVPVRFSVRCN